jgi:hypothetical protein
MPLRTVSLTPMLTQKPTQKPTLKQAQPRPKEQEGSKTYPSWYKFRQ